MSKHLANGLRYHPERSEWTSSPKRSWVGYDPEAAKGLHYPGVCPGRIVGPRYSSWKFYSLLQMMKLEIASRRLATTASQRLAHRLSRCISRSTRRRSPKGMGEEAKGNDRHRGVRRPTSVRSPTTQSPHSVLRSTCAQPKGDSA